MSICIIGRAALENFRGPEKFLVQFSNWLSDRPIKGVVICGSFKTLVRSIDINVSKMTPEGEGSTLIKHLPSILRSLLFSFLSFLKIIYLNKRQHFSIIHAQDANYGAMAAIAAAKLLDVPVILQIHGINMNVLRLLIRPNWLARLYRAYYLFLQRELIKRSSCVICVSENNRKYLPVGKKIVIPMGVNTASFQVAQKSPDAREEFKIPEHAFTLGYVGALSAGKGVHVLLKSFYYVLREMPQEASMYLLIVGDGSERKDLENLADKLGISQYLRLTGFRTDVSRLLGTMDMFILPSESEGSPMAILEAMAAGKAIIASNIPSIREIVKNGKEAVLVDHHSVEEFKRAILLLYNNSDLRAKLACAAREKVRLYDTERGYGQILDVYKELIHCKAI